MLREGLLTIQIPTDFVQEHSHTHIRFRMTYTSAVQVLLSQSLILAYD